MSDVLINLDDSQFDESSIFNGGNAGLVENVTVSVSKKTDNPKAKDNDPDYRIIFKDQGGSETNLAFWYLDPNDLGENNWKLTQQGRLLKHILRVVLNVEKINLPAFTSYREMLDKAMEVVASKAAGQTFCVFVNYGSKKKKEEYLRVRSWPPFMSLPSKKDSLAVTPSDNMVRVVADQEEEEEAGSSAGSVDWLPTETADASA